VRPTAGVLRLTALVGLALATSACDQDVVHLTLVQRGAFEVTADEELPGTLAVLDGTARIEPGGAVLGSVVVLGGRVEVDGRVGGDPTALGGVVRLGEGAQVDGDLGVAGELERHRAAVVVGRVTEGAAVPEALSGALRGEGGGWAATVARIVVLALLAWLTGRLAPRAVGRVADAASGHAVVAGALGLLALTVGIVLLVAMAFTIVLIPVSVVGILLGLATVAFGWLGLGLALGRWLAARAHRDWTPARAAFTGTLLVATVLTLLERVPLLWATLPIVAAAVGVGAVLLTGYGLRRFVRADAPP
jgi:hypothetical protein